MIHFIVRHGARVLYLGVAIVGLSMAASGYPLPESGFPGMLALGGLLAIVGVAGIIWPEKIRSGNSGPD